MGVGIWTSHQPLFYQNKWFHQVHPQKWQYLQNPPIMIISNAKTDGLSIRQEESINLKMIQFLPNLGTSWDHDCYKSQKGGTVPSELETINLHTWPTFYVAYLVAVFVDPLPECHHQHLCEWHPSIFGQKSHRVSYLARPIPKLPPYHSYIALCLMLRTVGTLVPQLFASRRPN